MGGLLVKPLHQERGHCRVLVGPGYDVGWLLTLAASDEVAEVLGGAPHHLGVDPDLDLVRAGLYDQDVAREVPRRGGR